MRFKLLPTLFGAILDVFPVFCPFLAPFKLQTAFLASSGLEAVFGLRNG